MSAHRRLLIASSYILVLLLLGATDALLTQDLNAFPIAEDDTTSSETGGVARSDGPDIFEILNDAGIVTETTREESLIGQIVPRNVEVESRVLLLDDDRLSFFSWVESSDVKVYFSALKESLHTSFSSELQDLVDEVQERDRKPVRNVLSFFDPAIHEERLLFIRVRQRLYEFHVPAGREPEVQELMDALTE